MSTDTGVRSSTGETRCDGREVRGNRGSCREAGSRIGDPEGIQPRRGGDSRLCRLSDSGHTPISWWLVTRGIPFLKLIGVVGAACILLVWACRLALAGGG